MRPYSCYISELYISIVKIYFLTILYILYFLKFSNTYTWLKSMKCIFHVVLSQCLKQSFVYFGSIHPALMVRPNMVHNFAFYASIFKLLMSKTCASFKSLIVLFISSIFMIFTIKTFLCFAHRLLMLSLIKHNRMVRLWIIKNVYQIGVLLQKCT